jgi:hypothetical protein
MGAHGQTDPYADGYNMLLGGSYVTYYLDGYGSGGTPQVTLSAYEITYKDEISFMTIDIKSLE